MSGRARNKHSIGVSPGTIEHECECGYKTLSKTGMKLHAKMSHGEKNPVINFKDLREQCEVCNKVFKSAKEVINHVKLVHRGK